MIFYDSNDFYIHDNTIKKKVTFDLFTEVIFIPRYSINSHNKLWWNIDEITSRRVNANYNEINKIKEYRMKTLQQLKKIL